MVRSGILRRPSTVLLAGLAVAVACSIEPTLDAASTESQILDQLQTAEEPRITAVDCPDGVEVAAGATFTCTATTEAGRNWTIEVTQADDAGTLDYRIGEQIEP